MKIIGLLVFARSTASATCLYTCVYLASSASLLVAHIQWSATGDVSGRLMRYKVDDFLRNCYQETIETQSVLFTILFSSNITTHHMLWEIVHSRCGRRRASRRRGDCFCPSDYVVFSVVLQISDPPIIGYWCHNLELVVFYLVHKRMPNIIVILSDRILNFEKNEFNIPSLKKSILTVFFWIIIIIIIFSFIAYLLLLLSYF